MQSTTTYIRERPVRGKSSGWWLLFGGSLAFLLGVMALVFSQAAYTGRVYPGVEVLGIDLGGLTPQQAANRLTEKLRYFDQGRIPLRDKERIWMATPRELGANLNVQATIDAAFRVGRSGPLAGDLVTQLQALMRDHTVAPVIEVNEATAATYLALLAAEIDRPPRDAALIISGSDVQVVESQIGRRLDVNATVGLIVERVGRLEEGEIILPIIETPPQIFDATQAANQVRQMLSGPLDLTLGDRHWELPPDVLANMLVFYRQPGPDGRDQLVPWLDNARLVGYVAELAKDVDQPPREARFKFDPATKSLQPTVISQAGRRLDILPTARRIAAQVMTPQRTVPLAVSVVTPTVSTADADRLGIRELIWEETSYFRGSSAGRAKNIQLATSRFDGVVIPAGATFSFNDILGEVSAAAGYDEQLIILDNQTQRGPGGGICQVSTTVFRAAFWSGYPILERWAHAYRVAYYEQGGKPVGLDATIYTPNVDFRFKNDSPTALLIEAKTNLAASTVTFRFYGTKTGRTVEMAGPVIENVVEPGPPVYRKDPSLPKGTRQQIEIARAGSDITLFRIVKNAGRVVGREEFKTHFVPTRATYLVNDE